MNRLFVSATLIALAVNTLPVAHSVGLGGGLSGPGNSIGRGIGGIEDRAAKAREDARKRRQEKEERRSNATLVANGPMSREEAVRRAEQRGGKAIGIRQFNTATGPVYKVTLRRKGKFWQVYVNRAKSPVAGKPSANAPELGLSPANAPNP